MDAVQSLFGAAMAAETPVDTGADGALFAPRGSGVQEEAAEAAAKVSAEADAMATPMTGLASFVMSRFQENESFRRRSGVTDRLDYCIRAQRLQFTDRQMEVLAGKFGHEVASKLFVPITSVKIRSARAMLIDLANQSGEPLFRIEPSPKPSTGVDFAEKAAQRAGEAMRNYFVQAQQAGMAEMPPEQLEKVREFAETMAEFQYDEVANAEENHARVRSERMQKKVWDLMLEGGWRDAFVEYLDYICTYGTGIIVGPVMRRVAKNECVRKGGVVRYVRTVKSIPTFEAVNPCDCYPAPDAKDVDDGPLCIRVKYTADELARFGENGSGGAGDGWISSVVNNLVARHPNGGVKLDIGTFSTDRRYCENNGTVDVADCTFEGVRCFATVRGSELMSIGVVRARRDGSMQKVDPEGFYRTETIVIDNRVVYCRVYSPAEDLPVSKGVFYTLPGSWWGESIADKVAMCQCILNNCIASLVTNMPAASGAIFWVNDVQRLVNKSPNALKLKAGMTVPFLMSTMGNQGAPIGSLSVPSNASELLNVFQRMQTQADLDSGLPAYTEGQSAGQGGALRTSSGLAIFTEASSRGMKMVMTTTDQNVISRVARLTADWVLLNDDDMDLKGDVEIMPVGLIGKILKAQRDQQRLQTFQLVMNNQTLQQFIGPKGIIEMFRPSLQDIDLNPDDILPSKTKMAELEMMQGIQQVFQATNALQGAQANIAENEGASPAPQPEGGAAPVEEPAPEEPTPGSVAERRGVA